MCIGTARDRETGDIKIFTREKRGRKCETEKYGNANSRALRFNPLGKSKGYRPLLALLCCSPLYPISWDYIFIVTAEFVFYRNDGFSCRSLKMLMSTRREKRFDNSIKYNNFVKLLAAPAIQFNTMRKYVVVVRNDFGLHNEVIFL